MRKLISSGVSCAAVALVMLGVLAHADEEKVPLDKVPKPVMDAVKARFKDAKVTGATKEMEDKKLVYEVTIKHEDHNIDVTLTPEGEILMIEKEIAAKDLPMAVAKALQTKYPKATYKIVEEIIKVQQKEEKLAYYEVLLVTAEKQALEVQVNAEGKILKEEKKKSAKPDDQ
jgi:uncharacterized membrane protein YkoI